MCKLNLPMMNMGDTNSETITAGNPIRNATPDRNPKIAVLAAGFCRIWTFRLGLKGGGALIRMIQRLFPGIQRFNLNYPELGCCNISFLDFFWIRQVTLGVGEEKALLENISSLVGTSPVVWDVGANSGYLAAEILLRLKPARLDLFEPNSAHRQTLESLAALDSRVRVHMIGLSDRSGNRILHIPRDEDGGSTCASLETSVVAGCNSLNYEEITLECGDDLVATGVAPPPDLLIIDVEGHEAEVVKGLETTIRIARPLIALEHLFISDATLERILPEGYQLFTVCDKTCQLIEGISRQRGHNTLMIPTGETVLQNI